MARRITVHVFDNHGSHIGTVTRNNVRGALLRRKLPPIVCVSRMLRECIHTAGYGWSVFLGEKASEPLDLKRP